MAGVPSIVYGFFGLVLMVPLIRNTFGGTGTSWLAASLLLGIMILPTIIGPTESALRSVSESYYEGSLALGATKKEVFLWLCFRQQNPEFWQQSFLVLDVRSVKPWRLIMVAGNQARMPAGLLKGLRTNELRIS